MTYLICWSVCIKVPDFNGIDSFKIDKFMKVINPFVLNAPFLYPQKTSENLTVSGGRERVHWEQTG